MFFGMTPFTFVHVLLSLVGIGSGFVVAYGLLTAKRLDGWTATFSGEQRRHERDRFFLSVRAFLAFARRRDYRACRAGDRDHRKVRPSSRRTLASGLCDQFSGRPLSQRLCPDRTALSESSGVECSCADSIRARRSC